jgi:hypothetical protein
MIIRFTKITVLSLLKDFSISELQLLLFNRFF